MSFANRTMVLARTILDAYVEGRRDLGDADAIGSCSACTTRPPDELATKGIDDNVDELVVLLTDLAQRALDEHAAPVCTVLASVAYQTGGGPLVSVAIERALCCDPVHDGPDRRDARPGETRGVAVAQPQDPARPPSVLTVRDGQRRTLVRP